MRGRTLVYYVSAWTRCPTDWGKFTLSDEESQISSCSFYCHPKRCIGFGSEERPPKLFGALKL
jgi:hypothetical protein